jgi:hypothetical protein
MASELDGTNAKAFSDRVAATAIVNQAVLKCLLLQVPVTTDNVILLVGDFADPSRVENSDLINEILIAVEEMTGLIPETPQELDS